MAGVPPLLGFVGKEAAFTALLDGGLPDPTAAAIELAVLVVGSALTAAYTLRFWWGAFARKPGLPDAAPAELVHRPGALFLAAPAVLVLAGLVVGPASPLLEPLVVGVRRDPAAARARGRGAGAVARLAAGPAAVGGQPARRCRAVRLRAGGSTGCSAGSPSAPRPTRATGTSSRGSTGSSVLVTGTTQRGSLPAYLGTILVVVLALPGTLLITRAPWPDEWRAWDTPVQALIGVVILHRGRRWRCASGSGCRSSSSSASPATAPPCCSPSRAPPTSRSPSSWSRR